MQSLFECDVCVGVSTPQEYGVLPRSQWALCVHALFLNLHGCQRLVEALLSFCLSRFLSGFSACSWPEGRPCAPSGWKTDRLTDRPTDERLCCELRLDVTVITTSTDQLAKNYGLLYGCGYKIKPQGTALWQRSEKSGGIILKIPQQQIMCRITACGV